MEKVYAVRKGKQPGLYFSWIECKEQIEGYSGAEFKSFEDLYEANEFLKGNKGNIDLAKKYKLYEQNWNSAVAFVGGSYDTNENICAYGVLLIYQGEVIELCGKVKIAAGESMQGDIIGIRAAMNYCIKNKIPNLIVIHKNTGVYYMNSVSAVSTKTSPKNEITTLNECYNYAKKYANIQFIYDDSKQPNEYSEYAKKLSLASLAEGQKRLKWTEKEKI